MSLIVNQSDNSQIPDQPEYGKSWKPQFNHGCCPNCQEAPAPVCTTTVQAFTRTSQDPSLVITIANTPDCPCQGEATIASQGPNPMTGLGTVEPKSGEI